MRHLGWKQAWLLACFMMALSPAAQAQDYPNRTIKLIVPTGCRRHHRHSGTAGRQEPQRTVRSARDHRQPHRRGRHDRNAGGRAGRARRLHPADGFPSHAANPALYASLPYDSEKDFAPISMVTRVSEILPVPNSSPAKSVKELVELARKGQLNYASVGVGSLAHLSTELFLTTAGVKMTHIPYRGVPQAQQAVMTGEVAVFFDTPVTALPQVRAGTVRALGISTAKRLTVAPDIPTIAEAGLAGYEVIGWNGIPGAGQYAAAHYRQTQQGHPRSPQVARDGEIADRARHRAGRQQPRRIRAADACRHRKMEAGDARGRHPAAIIVQHLWFHLSHRETVHCRCRSKWARS